MKLRSLAIAALLVPGFAACGKKDAPAPAPAPAAAPADPAPAAPTDAASNDLIKRALEHHTKVNEAIANAKGDVAATKAALEAISATDIDVLNAALTKLGEDDAAAAKAKETFAAEIAAAKKAQDAAAQFGAALEADAAFATIVGKLFLGGISNLVPESADVAAAGELAGGADKEGAEGAAAEGAEGAEGAAAEGAEGAEGAAEGEGAAAGEWALVNAEYEAVLKILEENAADPAAAAAALTKRATEAELAASEAVVAELKKLHADETAAASWALGAGKGFHERIEKLKADHPALFENETIAEILKSLAGEDDAKPAEGGEAE